MWSCSLINSTKKTSLKNHDLVQDKSPAVPKYSQVQVSNYPENSWYQTHLVLIIIKSWVLDLKNQITKKVSIGLLSSMHNIYFKPKKARPNLLFLQLPLEKSSLVTSTIHASFDNWRLIFSSTTKNFPFRKFRS